MCSIFGCTQNLLKYLEKNRIRWGMRREIKRREWRVQFVTRSERGESLSHKVQRKRVTRFESIVNSEIHVYQIWGGKSIIQNREGINCTPRSSQRIRVSVRVISCVARGAAAEESERALNDDLRSADRPTRATRDELPGGSARSTSY